MKFGENSKMAFFTNESTCFWCLRHELENSTKRSRRIQQQRYERENGGYHFQLHRQRHRRKGLWRPWVEEEDDKTQIHSNLQRCSNFTSFNVFGMPIQSPPQFQHPVKLVWPKKPYDYMYAEGERLLKDFPVQATLEFATDSESESDDYDYDDSENNVDHFNERQSIKRNELQELHARA